LQRFRPDFAALWVPDIDGGPLCPQIAGSLLLTMLDGAKLFTLCGPDKTGYSQSIHDYWN